MRKFRTLWIVLTLALVACEQTGALNPDAPIVYSGSWVTFSYPGSWQLNEENTGTGNLIRIQGPHEARFTIHIRSLDQAPSLEAYAASLGNDQGLLPTARPATSGRLHGFVQTLELDGEAHQRELHRIDSHDEVAYLVSQVPTAQAIRVQSGLDRIFTTFAFQ
jgi:hypothetical protein